LSVKLGFHVSIQGGVDKAVDRADAIGCTTFQIFTQSPRMWRRRELREDEVKGRMLPWYERALERFAAWVMSKPGLYRWGVKTAKRLRIAKIVKGNIPFDLPEKTFYELWDENEEGKQG